MTKRKRLLSPTLAVAFVLFGALGRAYAQQPRGETVPAETREAKVRKEIQKRVDPAVDQVQRELELRLEVFEMEANMKAVAEQTAEPDQPVRPLWNDQQIERLTFADGDASSLRQRLDGLLAQQISELHQAYTLTDAQKKKLHLAGRGDIKRFFENCERVREKLQLIAPGQENLQQIIRDRNRLWDVSNDLFHDDESLLCKSLRNTLTAEQLAQYEAMVEERRAFGQVRLLEGHQGPVWSTWVTRLAVAPDGRHVVTVGGAVHLWDVETGKAVRVFGQDQRGYWSVAFSPDGRQIATGSNDHTARIWDTATGKEVRQFTGHRGAVWGVAFVANGRQLVTGAWDQSLRLWEVETGKQVRSFEGVRDHIRCLACSPDGKLVAAGHFAAQQQPGILRLWELAQGKEIRTFRGHTQEISSVAFSPDGRMLLTSSHDNTVRLWDVDTGREVKRFEGHTYRVEGAAFSPDGCFVVSCGNQHDPTVRIWDVAQGQQLLRSESCEGGFLAVAVVPKYDCVVTTGKDNLGRLWPWKRLSNNGPTSR